MWLGVQLLNVEKIVEELLQELNSTAEETIQVSKVDKTDPQPFTNWCLNAIGQISARLPNHDAKLAALRVQLS